MEHYLSFELDESGQRLEIHGDESGLRLLAASLKRLVAATPPGGAYHEHLMTDEWGGTELSANPQTGRTLHSVKIVCWKTLAPGSDR